MLFQSCEGGGTAASIANASEADCTVLQATMGEKMTAINSYRSSDDYDSSDAELKATCDGKCTEYVTSVQALLDNSCEWPVIPGYEDEMPTGAVTQEHVDQMTTGFCGDNGVC